MARCESCNKFVSLELDDSPDVDSSELGDGDESLVLEATVMYACAECSTEMRTGTVEATVVFSDDVKEAIHAHCGSKSVEAEIASCEENGTGKKNDPIKVVVEFSYTVTCDGCDAEITHGTITAEISKGEMDEC
jgi:hypothetical protein